LGRKRTGKRSGSSKDLITAKNALRPFYNRQKPLRRWPQFQTVRVSAPLNDLASIYRITEHNPAFQFEGLGNTFPRDPGVVPDATLKRLEPLSLSRELSLQIGRINHHASQLTDALTSLAEANAALASNDWDRAERLLTEHFTEYGYSLIWAKKALLCAFQRGGLASLSRQYKSITRGADRRAWGILCHLYYDMADSAYHPFKSLKNWLHVLSDRTADARWYRDLACWNLYGHVCSEEELSSTILSSGGASLIDLVLTIWSRHEIHDSVTIKSALYSKLCPTVRSVLDQRFSSISLSIPDRYMKSNRSVSDLDLYRFSFFFDEVNFVASWRNQLTGLLHPDRMSAFAFGSRTDHLLAGAALAMENETDGLAGSEAIVEKWLRQIAPEAVRIDQSWVIAVVIAQFLKNVDVKNDISSKYIVSLISKADDLHDHLSYDHIARLHYLNRDNEPIIKFFVRDFLFKKVRSPDNDLERRAAFMDIIPDYDRHNILSYLTSVSMWSKPAAIYLARTCTRTFLERLYMIMTSVQDVIESRIEICSWILKNDSNNLESITEELEALRRELSNLDARSDIDSTRVHVDEEALKEWYLETQYPQTSRYIQTVIAEGREAKHESFLKYYNELLAIADRGDKEDFIQDTQIGSEFILLSLVEKTLDAFVSDRSFGLNAYLSRRIRHGTLGGFMLTPVARIVRRARDAAPGSERTAATEDLQVVQAVLEQWRLNLASKLDHARKNIIQINSDACPEGKIAATWRNASGVTHLDAMFSRVRQRVLDADGAYDIFPDIYAVCWDLIERDLAQIRLYLVKEFLREANDMLAHAFANLSTDQQVIAFRYVSDLREAIESRVLEVCGWFIRPMVRRDNYDLTTLVDSMLSIVRELDESYNFRSEVLIEHKSNISRGTFEIVSDILFVLIGNAAKHGKKGGLIGVTSRVGGLWRHHLELSIVSEVETSQDMDVALGRIHDAMDVNGAGELDTAAVAEGFTGIRKLLGVLQRVKSDRKTLECLPNRKTRTITFRVGLPIEIAAGRGTVR